MDLIKRLHQPLLLLLLALCVLLSPSISEASLMQIRFDLQKDDTSFEGLGYWQFDTIETGAWVRLSRLQNFSCSLATSVISVTDDSTLHIRFTGSLRIREVATNAYVVDFLYDQWFDSMYWSMDWPFIIRSTLGDQLRMSPPDNGLFASEIPMETLTDLNWAGKWTAGPEIAPIWEKGAFTTSVWFDDPPPVPEPASGILLLTALMPIVGFRRNRGRNPVS